MKKRILSLLLAAATLLSLCACGKPQETASEPTQTTPEPTETEAPEMKDSLVLSLAFEENVQDSSPLGNNGTVNKDAAYVEGVDGKAIRLDGGTYIDLGTSTSLQPAQLTFAAWIRAEGSLAGEHMITWFKPSGKYQGQGWYLSCLDNNTPLKLSVGPSAGQPMEIFVSGSRDAFFPAGQWVHIAVTYDSSSHTAAIYRNGIAQDVQYINGTSEIGTDAESHKYIGFNSPGYNGGFAKMDLDQLEIYSEVLSAADIVEIYTRYGAEFDGAQVVQNDHDSLNLSITSVKNDISLPTGGPSGSAITWSSSDESVLSSDGKVTRPAAGHSDAEVILTARITYAGHTLEKQFTLTVEAESAFSGLSDFSLGDVTLLNAYEVNAFSKEVAYLKSLEADRLLRGFCDIADIPSDAAKYGGWENSSIQGHTLGHYLSAVSQAYAASGDPELLAIAEHIVEVLAQCQNAETGYLAAIPESHYIQLESGNTAGTWVPWYTMHKVLAGLLHAYELTGNDQALTVASRLGDWVYSRTSTWSAATQATVLNVEYGGMNDVLYELYSHTGSEDHLSAAHSFDEMTLFDSLYAGEDVLNGKHANTTIPKIIGALNRYITLGEGEAYYLQVAENFWEIVVKNHSYITGGNSEWEHFGEAGVLDAERTNCNCETCNTYNMLKLTRELFKLTGNRKYADYYENTYINAILSSQNPETGMTTYFQPMATGFFKVYSSETGHFWCCTGSGMENFSKLGDSIYYHDADSIYVTRYTASSVSWAEKGLKLTVDTDLPMTDRVNITISGSASADIVLRIPDWVCSAPEVQVNGVSVNCAVVNGFVRLPGQWADGDVINLTLPMEVVAYSLPDNENAAAFKYGPLVLSADLGNEDLSTGVTGVSVTIPSLDSSISDVIRVDGTIEGWLESLSENLVRTPGTLEFTLRNTDRELTFSPHYMQHKSRYGIYFILTDANSQAQEDEADRYITIDSLPVANDQYEFSHDLQGDLTGTGMHKGLNYRHAEADGYFSYRMAVEPEVTNYLQVKYFSGDAGRKFTIYVDGEVLANVTLENVNPDNFYDVYYEIPAELTAGKEAVTVTFSADMGGYAGGIFDTLRTVKEK